MRFACLLIAAIFVPTTGCSLLVVNSGKDLSALTTQAEVQQSFGPPSVTATADGQVYEEFTTHRKIAQPWMNIYLCTYDVATLGLIEFVAFPQVLYQSARGTLLGQRLRFTYDAAGNVTQVQLNGEAVPWGAVPTPANSQAGPTLPSTGVVTAK